MNREILRLAIPSILANITVPIVGMVDMGIAGHLGTGGFTVAALISGITVGSMLFDLLYWNFAFLRVGTGGLTAQSCGRGDFRGCADHLSRAMCLALLISIAVIALQWIVVKAAFLVIDCTPEVQQLASQYFFIRIWAAPATLSLMALRGWFIGMQDSLSSMAVDLVVNAVNIVASLVLALGIHAGGIEYSGIGFPGIAAGTVIAQYTGFICAIGILFFKYRRRVFRHYRLRDYFSAVSSSATRAFFSMNTNLFMRSVCILGIYVGFTMIAAKFGDVLLATSSIMMKILMIFSYITDGFAYAGEAMTGKYIGMKSPGGVSATVKHTFIWSMGIAIAFIVIYILAGMPLVRLLTSDTAVISACRHYLPWLVVMPVVGCAAFTWDGIYIGATASRTMRNSLLWATAAFFTFYFTSSLVLTSTTSDPTSFSTSFRRTSATEGTACRDAVDPAVLTSSFDSAIACSAVNPAVSVLSSIESSASLSVAIDSVPVISSAVDPVSSFPAADPVSPHSVNHIRLHLLLAAYFLHLLIRTLHLSAHYPRLFPA